ncbi:hypothetical protein D3C72_2048750 [compost metagenome]
MKVTLDPAPFNGRATIVPVGASTNTQTYDLSLVTGNGAEVVRKTFTRRQTMILSNLKAGESYRVTLTARRANGGVTGTASAGLSWDASALELEQDVTVTLVF